MRSIIIRPELNQRATEKITIDRPLLILSIHTCFWLILSILYNFGLIIILKLGGPIHYLSDMIILTENLYSAVVRFQYSILSHNFQRRIQSTPIYYILCSNEITTFNCNRNNNNNTYTHSRYSNKRNMIIIHSILYAVIDTILTNIIITRDWQSILHIEWEKNRFGNTCHRQTWTTF